MAQRVYWNWEDEDSTFDLSSWLSGVFTYPYAILLILKIL